MLHRHRSSSSISLATVLWLLVSAFSLVLIFFGIKVENIHRSVLLNEDQKFRDDFVSSPGHRHLNVIPSPTSAPTPSANTVSAVFASKSRLVTSTKNTSSTSCHWYPPYDQMASYPQFDEQFEGLQNDFEVQNAIKYITKRSKHFCTTFPFGYIFKFDDAVPIAIATVIILPSKRPNVVNETQKIDIFRDIRTYIFRMNNALRYAERHGYSLIVQTRHIFEYKFPSNSRGDYMVRNQYEEWMKGPTFQKPFLLKRYLSDYQWMVWMDYDAIFLNCNNKIQDIIRFAQRTHPRHEEMSLIFGGERFATMNAGVWMIRNSEWSHRFLSDWIYLEENAEKFQILKADDVHRDQPLFVALLQGFNVRKRIVDDTWRELKYHNDLAQKKYLEQKLKLNFEDMLRRPIWDDTNARYAVSIDEALINAKTPHFRKGTANELDMDMRYMWVMHFYWQFKYRTKTVFQAFDYSVKHC